MIDNAADLRQEAYGQFYLPLTNKGREHGIDAISTQCHSFDDRWKMFHTGTKAACICWPSMPCGGP